MYLHYYTLNHYNYKPIGTHLLLYIIIDIHACILLHNIWSMRLCVA